MAKFKPEFYNSSDSFDVRLIGEKRLQTVFNVKIKWEFGVWEFIKKNIFRSRNLPHKVKIEVSINNSDFLDIDKNRAFQIRVGEHYIHKRPIVLDTNLDTGFSLVFDPSSIKDGSPKKRLKKYDKKNKEYWESYEPDGIIKFTDTVSNKTKPYSFKLKIKLILPADAIRYSLKLLTENSIKFTPCQDTGYDQPTMPKRWPKIAKLEMRHVVDNVIQFKCAPAVNLSFELEAILKDDTNLENRHDIKLDPNQIVPALGMIDNKQIVIFSETNPVYQTDGVAINGGKLSVLHVERDDTKRNKYHVSNLYGYPEINPVNNNEKNTVTIAIHVDMAQFKNPVDKGQLILTVKHFKNDNNIDQTTTIEKTITINRNKDVPILEATLNDAPNKYDLLNNCTKINLIKKPISENESNRLPIVFFNQVDNFHHDKSIIIGDFNLHKNRIEKEDDRIIFRDEQKIEDIFELTKPKNDFIWLLPQEKLILSFNYYANRFVKIKPLRNDKETIYETTVIVPFSFKYYEDQSGTIPQQNNDQDLFNRIRSAAKDVECKLVVRLENRPSPDWLSVDFGTSALVALYKIDRYNNLLPLNRHRKEEFVSKVYPGNDNIKQDSAEQSDIFLPTVTYFNYQNEGDYEELKSVESYSKSAIWFSPTMGMTASLGDYQLPSLKLILGFKYLPDIFSNSVHDRFIYYTKDHRKNQLRQTDSNDLSEICNVDKLIKIIYNQLFEYHLKPLIERVTKYNKRSLEKIVLAIPNTFTPNNIQMLRNIILEVLPSIREDYIRFVRESDAVACYYIANENIYNQRRNRDKRTYTPQKNKSGSNNTDDYILIYDMGAGTLDLTYLHRTRDKDDLKYTIKGNMGVSKAGDYLDFIIAEILIDLINKKRDEITEASEIRTNEIPPSGDKEDDSLSSSQEGGLDFSETINGGYSGHEEKESIVSHSDIFSVFNSFVCEQVLLLDISKRGTYSSLAHTLKKYVSKDVKPLLSSGQNNQLLPNLRIDNISYQVPFFVEDITGHILFKKFINESTEDVLNQFSKMFSDQKNALPVDILVFSGRGTNLSQITDKVAEFLGPKGTMNPRGKNFRCEFISNMIDSCEDGLKTAVARGALEYVSFFDGKVQGKVELKRKTIYARFGVLYRDVHEWNYLPFFEPNDTTSYDTPRSEIKYLPALANQILLIQTYSIQPAKDWASKKREMISVLYSRYEEIAKGTELTLEMNKDYMLTFKIGGAAVDFYSHVDFNDETLQKSLWPVIFNNNNNIQL